MRYYNLHYQKRVNNDGKSKWIWVEARIPEPEFESLARKILARKNLFYEILRIIRGG